METEKIKISELLAMDMGQLSDWMISKKGSYDTITLSPQTEQAEASSLSDLVIPLEDWDKLYWGYNLPVQMWKGDDGYRVVNYMPRKERIISLNETVSEKDLPQFCKNSAAILRNLAELFEALGRGEIEAIYYPDETIEEAKSKAVQRRINTSRPIN